jgi:preprotein translocase subunit SecG
MIILSVILILLACIILAFFVLIQNPKGGGLSGAFGAMSSQVMGVKQSTDIMEKGTWTMISVIAGLCIITVMFFQKTPGSGSTKQEIQKSAPAKKK